MAAPGGGSGGALSYIPQPHERTYYDGLFQAADIQRKGAIGGPEAVAFFSRSKLPLEQLKNIWTVADNPPSNALDRRKFAVAVRLIQLLQNGVKGQGANLVAPPGTNLRPVFLEGISGVSVQLPSNLQQQQQQSPAQQPQQSSGGRPPMVPQSPAGPSSVGGASVVGGHGASTALTVQDPYTLTPQERSRYESLFPQYAKEDGYMHGKEAVELFSKSGLDQSKLRDIWNMADQPVDNKLDKLEFAIAMHLIVCVSKKNLPMPKLLPLSLKSLKQQQQQQPPQDQPTYNSPQQQEQQPITAPPPANRIHTPTGGESVMSGMTQPTIQGPPPITETGGMDISDAFEGLNAAAETDGLGGLPPPAHGLNLGSGTSDLGQQASTRQPSYAGGIGATSSFGQTSPKLGPTKAAPLPSPPRIKKNIQPSASAVSVVSSTPDYAPKSPEALASSYKMSDSSGELEKLKTVLQKLQAENISLKAQLGTITGEEKDVQKQINATVSEIGELSNRLATLRAEVLASKTRLLELTAELKAAQEKKGVMNDLIGEAEATKEAIETAHQGLEASIHAAHAPPPAPGSAPSYEADLFDFGAAPVPPSNIAAAPSNDSHHEPQHGHAPAPFPAPFPASAPIPHREAGGVQQPHVDTVSSDDSSDAHQEHFNSNVAGDNLQDQPLFTYDLSYDAANARGQDESDPYQGISLEQNFQNNPPPGHNKQSSISSLNFEVMGGGPAPQNQFAFHHEEEEQDLRGAEVPPAPSLEEIEHLKNRAKEADDLARDSETTLRQLMAKADELRQAADNAELEARQRLAEASEKKKGGFMGGGKKKKSMKEATQAQADAEAKKKMFLEAQSRANDAQAVAMETKREADKLRKEAEQLEIDAAAAASMENQPARAPQPPNGYQNQGQYAQSQGYGQPPPAAHGYGGYDQNPRHGGEYNPSVMGGGGGGMEIPDPRSDPYSNPF